MEKLRDDEFIINEPMQHSQANLLSAVVMELGSNDKFLGLMQQEQAFITKKMALRRQNIRANRDAMAGVIDNATVQGLYDMGEIGWSQAITLDHFTTLCREDQEEIIGLMEHDIDKLLDKYQETNACMAMMMATFDSANIMAVTALQNAQTMALPKSKVATLSRDELDEMLVDNYIEQRQKFDKCFTSMETLIRGEDCAIYAANDLRKRTARELVTTAHYVDMCCMITHSTACNHFRSIMGMVKYGSLPRDTINHIAECKLKYDMRLFDDVMEISSGRGRSDLIVLDDTEREMQKSA